MEQEVNSLGETYEWEYRSITRKTWDEVNDSWDDINEIRTWDTLGVEGGWKVTTWRDLRLQTAEISNVKERGRSYLNLITTRMRNSGEILSDVVFDNKTIDFDNFQNLALTSGPVGYTDIRPLYPGEYTYKDALVGIRMRRFALDVTMGFYGAVLNVDVEDVIDRGTVSITKTNGDYTTVYFKKHYYYTPEELMFTIANFSEPCQVEVGEKTPTYFTLRLKSTTTANRYIAGEVTWLSTGY